MWIDSCTKYTINNVRTPVHGRGKHSTYKRPQCYGFNAPCPFCPSNASEKKKKGSRILMFSLFHIGGIASHPLKKKNISHISSIPST